MRSDDFVKYLSSAAIYFLRGNLFIDLILRAMEFAPAPVSELAPPDGESTVDEALPEDVTAQLDTFLQSQIYTEGGILRWTCRFWCCW